MNFKALLPPPTAEASLGGTAAQYRATFNPGSSFIRPAGLYHPPSAACLRACYKNCALYDVCDDCETICSGGVSY